MRFGASPRMHIKKDVFKKDWILCSNYDNHSRFNNQCHWWNFYDHLMNVRIFTLISNKIIIRAPKTMRKVAMLSLDLDLLTSCTNCMSHILEEVG